MQYVHAKQGVSDSNIHFSYCFSIELEIYPNYSKPVSSNKVLILPENIHLT